jgi:hypothetical protein
MWRLKPWKGNGYVLCVLWFVMYNEFPNILLCYLMQPLEKVIVVTLGNAVS